MNTPSPHCPSCHSPRTTVISYGLPEEIPPAGSDACVAMGGDVLLEGHSDKWICLECRHTWGCAELAEDLALQNKVQKATDARQAAEYEAQLNQAKAAADLRGVKDMTPNAHGFGNCPWCHRSFPMDYPQCWDGKRHLHETCLDLIRIVR